MSMFPAAGAEIHYNEAGEPTGWDYPSDDPMDYYCDRCGACHPSPCEDDYQEEE
jgi:hypothetical protein